MELTENLEVSNNLNNNFIQSTFGNVINSAVEKGIRALFPDYLEENIIDIKNNIINKDFTGLINNTIDTAINIGKNKLDNISENFQSIGQVSKIFKNEDFINGVSSVIDKALGTLSNKGFINEKIIEKIKDGKNTIMEKINSNVNNEIQEQTKKVEKMEKYNEKWKKAFEEKNFEKMEKNMKQIDKLKKQTIPIEKIINDANTIKNIHEIIKNNGNNFDLSDDILDLAKLLS